MSRVDELSLFLWFLLFDVPPSGLFILNFYYASFVFFLALPSLILFSPFFSLEAMSHPAAGTPLSLIGQTAALSLQLTLRPLNISMFQVGADMVCVLVSCHRAECSLVASVSSPFLMLF